MPDNIYGWYFFVLYTVGSVGGLVYIMDKAVAAWRTAKKDYDNDRTYDPWLAQLPDDPASAPVANPVTHIEPPISARTK